MDQSQARNGLIRACDWSMLCFALLCSQQLDALCHISMMSSPHILAVEGAHDMEDAVHRLDVRQEVVAQAGALAAGAYTRSHLRST